MASSDQGKIFSWWNWTILSVCPGFWPTSWVACGENLVKYVCVWVNLIKEAKITCCKWQLPREAFLHYLLSQTYDFSGLPWLIHDLVLHFVSTLPYLWHVDPPLYEVEAWYGPLSSHIHTLKKDFQALPGKMWSFSSVKTSSPFLVSPPSASGKSWWKLTAPGSGKQMFAPAY